MAVEAVEVIIISVAGFRAEGAGSGESSEGRVGISIGICGTAITPTQTVATAGLLITFALRLLAAVSASVSLAVPT